MSSENTTNISNQPNEGNINERKTVHIYKLSLHTTDNSLQKVFSEIGTVTKCVIIREPISQRSLRFGFVTYDKAEDAKRAVEQLNGTEVDGFRISVDFARREEARDKTPGRYLGSYFNRTRERNPRHVEYDRYESNYYSRDRLYRRRTERSRSRERYRPSYYSPRRSRSISPRDFHRDRYENDDCYSPRERSPNNH
ncbi:hypothetical protein, conserved [Entamoeba dispar SAW760]|uniref:RRM domain-containing protein n=1 Tax=Entamoeba dispar (strain ATCC PRA-260 / SAW760) TaxID=370354 RepID=B0ESR7_ENTDS|nr:uncharacterized protein EDI_343860 [Entamoeba dispar SAW760]EDR22445.1 hypothetical protein, conserved [Entamoeba dispar SAW760]|eukprot:EDR22445.1 hypothetical protein, conserved [Entamoeba dispar SAW760]